MNKEEREQLRHLANDAKEDRPGKWRGSTWNWTIHSDEHNVCEVNTGNRVKSYIAAADPPTVLELLDQIDEKDKLQKKLDEIEERCYMLGVHQKVFLYHLES